MYPPISVLNRLSPPALSGTPERFIEILEKFRA
jgi:hypothetical protein